MKLLKHLLTAFAALFSFAAQAQEFDSVHVDNSTYPGTTYVRIKFPHDGFRFAVFVQQGGLSLPPNSNMNFFFRECNGNAGTTFFDTTVVTYVVPDERLYFNLLLEPNTWDTTCVLRNTRTLADTFFVLSSQATSVENTVQSGIAVYPNPVTNHSLRVHAGQGTTLADALLYSLQGTLLASFKLENTQAEIALPSHIPTGNYLLYIKLGNGGVNHRIIAVQ